MDKIEAIAESWASIDGHLDAFRACKADPEREGTEGRYGGYMAEAKQFYENLQRRGFYITSD